MGKKCGRCSTRYCGGTNARCSTGKGSHDQLCEIKKAGGAEQYNANKKYAEAVAVAADKCAEDTKGQACYMCRPSHWKTKRSLVRECSCRGTASFARVVWPNSGENFVRGGEENNLDDNALNERWNRWHTCSLCEQGRHGVACCALG